MFAVYVFWGGVWHWCPTKTHRKQETWGVNRGDSRVLGQNPSGQFPWNKGWHIMLMTEIGHHLIGSLSVFGHYLQVFDIHLVVSWPPTTSSCAQLVDQHLSTSCCSCAVPTSPKAIVHSKGMDHYQKWFNWCFKRCCGRCFVTKIAVVFWPNFHSWWIFRSQWIGSWMLQSGLTFSSCCSCFAAIFACLKQHTSCMSFHMYTMFANQKAAGKHQDTDAKSADLFWGNVSGEVINQRHCL